MSFSGLTKLSSDIISPKLFRPISLVLHGNQYLDSLKRNRSNPIAGKSLENIKVNVKDNEKRSTTNNNNKFNTSTTINAKDWLQNLYNSNGTETISLSRGLKHNTDKSIPEFVLVSSNDEKSLHKAWNLASNTQSSLDGNKSTSSILSVDHMDFTTKPNISSTTSKKKQQQIEQQQNQQQVDSNNNTVEDYLLWRKIQLGEVRERFRLALENMRDFSIQNIHNFDKIPKSSQQQYLDNLKQAEQFIHMDVVLATQKNLDKLYEFLNLPKEYNYDDSQSRVALQILNATMCAWIYDEPITRPSSTNNELNEKYSQLSKELYESLVDSMICSCNYAQ